MRLSDFDYNLPDGLIAQAPCADRRDSRLMHLDGASGAVSDHRFAQFGQFFKPGDLLVFNDTRVIKARLYGTKDTGGKVEVMVERVLDTRRALAMLRASRTPKIGQHILLSNGAELSVLSRENDLFELHFSEDVFEVLDQCGQIPLPPYIERQAALADESRYQTVYARQPGAVAAPTAGLHFDETMIESLQAASVHMAYVTLHVGAGTFQPVRDDDIDRHVMHQEWYRVPREAALAVQRARQRGGRICAIGTTSLRALESAALESAALDSASSLAGEILEGDGETRLFIRPGFRFRVVERLLTNFHLPRSTLLMLVSAFAGLDAVRRAYGHAVQEQYRFFSYGDAMLIEAAVGNG